MSVLQTKEMYYAQGSFHINSVSITFPSGEITGIVGPNGSGKSTLLKLIARLLHNDSGDIYLGNISIKNFSRKEFAKQLTMLLQSKELTPNLTVSEIVAYGRTPYQTVFNTGAQDDCITQWAIEIAGLTHLQKRLYATLSGGEQQRVRIAMALAQKTDILLLDEPTTYLDLSHQLELMDLLLKLNHEYGMTVIMVLHELQLAAAYCHHMVVMKEGDVYVTGVPSQILTTALLKDVYDIEASIKYEEEYPFIIPKRMKRRS